MAALPATSLTFAVIVVDPSLGISPDAKLTDHVPPLAIVAVLVVDPNTTLIVLPSAPALVPLTVTPAVFSELFTILSVATVLIVIVGAVVSMVRDLAVDADET